MPYTKSFRDTLYNRDWLYEKYIVENLNASQIAKLVGCDNSAVSTRLRKFQIPIKTLSESQKGVPRRGSDAPRPRKIFLATIQDREWLYKQYVEKNQNLEEVAELARCSAQSVRQALQKFGIDLKTASEAKAGRPNFKKRDNPEYTQDSTVRVAARQYARRLIGPGPCAICGRAEGVKIDVNHKDRDWSNGDPSNLERLCKVCHMSQNAREMWLAFEWLEQRFGVSYIDLHREVRRRILEERGNKAS